MTMHDDSSRPADDWYAQALQAHARREKQRSSSRLSADWTRGHGKEGGVRDLRHIRDTVRNVVRVHGVPKNCRVDLAVQGLGGAAAAGFDDAPAGFERPYILLDKGPYETCPADRVLDVYLGLGLHEAGHVLHTRDGYRRLAAGLSRQRRWYENLLEDERIEELVRQESRGFAPYLQTTKWALLECQELGQALARWDDLPDLDKVSALIFAFIRCPYLITAPMRAWTVVNGECVFATLRALLPAAPVDEAGVASGAVQLEQLWERLRRLYAEDDRTAGPAAGDLGTGPTPAAAGERRQRQRRADAEDRALEGATAGGSLDLEEAIQRLLQEAAGWEAAGAPAEAQALLVEALRWQEAGDIVAARRGRRFGAPESERLWQRSATVTRPLDPAEAEALNRLERERVTAGDCWEWGGDRRTLVTHPAAGEAARQAYARARQEVQGHIAALRAALAVRLVPRPCDETERPRGRLHPRRLALAPVSDRVFRSRTTRTAPGLALALLLDGSGSMTRGKPAKRDVALRVAVLAVEALRSLPGIELEVYAHTTCGPADRDCLVQYLYGQRNPDRTALGCYGGWRENYDHQAILTAAELFRRHTRNPHRLLIVVSDGAPNGRGYGGAPAIRATREAVEAVRRRGVQVLNVAINEYASEAIFGAAHVFRFTDLGRLVADVRILLGRLVRRATEGR